MEKEVIWEKEENTPNNKLLNFKNKFWCQDITFAEFASLVKTLAMFDLSNKCHMK